MKTNQLLLSRPAGSRGRRSRGHGRTAGGGGKRPRPRPRSTSPARFPRRRIGPRTPSRTRSEKVHLLISISCGFSRPRFSARSKRRKTRRRKRRLRTELHYQGPRRRWISFSSPPKSEVEGAEAEAEAAPSEVDAVGVGRRDQTWREVRRI